MAKTRKLLIVEDEAFMQNALADKFSKEKDIVVVRADNGEDGLKTALKEKPDLIMLDVVMPKMDGMSMMKKLREESWGKDAEVVFLTNMTDPTLVAEAAKVAVYDFLVKTDWKLDDVVKLAKDKLANLPDEEEEE
jgi:two-component system, OmpR family, alkaline phosphatase synthesis response regulator PhoP